MQSLRRCAFLFTSVIKCILTSNVFFLQLSTNFWNLCICWHHPHFFPPPLFSSDLIRLFFQAPSPTNTSGSACQSSPEDCGRNSGDVTVQSSSSRGSNSRWSTLSWDAPSELLSPPTPDLGGTVPPDGDSRPSSGKYTPKRSPSAAEMADMCDKSTDLYNTWSPSEISH